MHFGFPIGVPLFIIFCLWLNYELRKGKEEDSFWQREREANNAPAKSLTELEYITIPLDKLPFGALPGHPEVDHMEYTIKSLADPGRKIVNLTGYTNTDLKFMYGAANLPILTKYDNSYITLVTTLQDWAQVLSLHDKYEEAACIAEYAVSTGTDTIATYKLLCKLYKDHLGLSSPEAKEKISALRPKAEAIRSMNRDSIVSFIDEQGICP